MGKMTRHQLRKRLTDIVTINHRMNQAQGGKGIVTITGNELAMIYRDIAFLAKCVRYIESHGPSVGGQVEIKL